MNPYGSDRIAGFVSMDVDSTNGNIYMVFASRNLPPDFSDIYFIASGDGGSSWSTPVAINANPGFDRSQFFPWLSIDQSSGRIDVIWYDQINGSGTSDVTDVFHTHSFDAGASWSCPTPLTDKPFHAEYGNRTSQPNIGDYNQCVSEATKLYTSFAKTDAPSYATYAPDTYVDISDIGGADATITFGSTSFSDAGCGSSNGIIEQEETIDLFVTIENYASCSGPISGISGTLSTTTPGITWIDFSQPFPDLGGAGSSSTNGVAFVFELDTGFTIGDDIDMLLTLSTSDGQATVPFSLPTGSPNETILLSETFDGVTTPALPAGWTTVNVAGAVNPWVTSTTFAASGTNSAFCADIGETSYNRLLSPQVAIPANCDIVDVTFDITHNMEHDVERRAWDGGVLKIEIDDGTVKSVFAGSFASLFEPFYPWQVNRSSSDSQPIQDQSCWSSNVTPNFSQVHLQYPGLAGTLLRLRFEVGTDEVVGTSTGMFVDNVVIKSGQSNAV